jgi:hypothetical protein
MGASDDTRDTYSLGAELFDHPQRQLPEIIFRVIAVTNPSLVGDYDDIVSTPMRRTTKIEDAVDPVDLVDPVDIAVVDINYAIPIQE